MHLVKCLSKGGIQYSQIKNISADKVGGGGGSYNIKP